MANSLSAFYETLIAAEGEFNRATVGQAALLDQVRTDISSEAGRVGKTIDVWFPDLPPPTDIGAGNPVPKPIAPNYISMVFQSHPCIAVQVQDFEQWQTATEVITKFLDPAYKRTREYLNGQIAALVTPANFQANAPIISATAQEVLVADQLAAWDALADNKVPLDDPNDLSLLVHNRVLRKMLGDANWVQENIVSAAIAEKAREQAKLANAFNFRPIWDQQMPTASGSIIYGQVYPTNGSTAVTGTNTQFTVDLAVGNYLTFGSDPTATQYKVAAIGSDTSLTLSANYGGTTPNPSYGTTARRITVLAGTVGVTNGSASVTGSGTSFTTALSVGQWLVFSNDATATPYQILSIGSNTALTLASNYGGATASGLTGTVQSYTSLALHRNAIACALRPIATPATARRVSDVMYMDLRGIPVRVMRSYVPIYMAEMVTVDFGYALQVIRPNFGVIIQA